MLVDARFNSFVSFAGKLSEVRVVLWFVVDEGQSGHDLHRQPSVLVGENASPHLAD